MFLRFSSPCGVWIVSVIHPGDIVKIPGFRPLAGCGLFLNENFYIYKRKSFRPLAGCGLFRHKAQRALLFVSVFVPLRGVDCFRNEYDKATGKTSFRPLAGCGLFLQPKWTITFDGEECFRPLAGCGLFLVVIGTAVIATAFSSPCGVWIVSLTVADSKATVVVFVPLRGVDCFIS